LAHIRKHKLEDRLSYEWECLDNNNSGSASPCCGNSLSSPLSPERQEPENSPVTLSCHLFKSMNLDQLSKWALQSKEPTQKTYLVDFLAYEAGQRCLNIHCLLGQSCCPFVQNATAASDEFCPNDDAAPSVPDDRATGDGERKKTTTTSKVKLYSVKMRGLRDLLLAERMNSSALQLQLTAQQSEVRRGKAHPPAEQHLPLAALVAPAGSNRVKRLRRD
jgi:hypothetical protein